jgi:hypothetical protein
MTTICHSTVVTPYWVNFATWQAQIELIFTGFFRVKFWISHSLLLCGLCGSNISVVGFQFSVIGLEVASDFWHLTPVKYSLREFHPGGLEYDHRAGRAGFWSLRPQLRLPDSFHSRDWSLSRPASFPEGSGLVSRYLEPSTSEALSSRRVGDWLDYTFQCASLLKGKSHSTQLRLLSPMLGEWGVGVGMKNE